MIHPSVFSAPHPHIPLSLYVCFFTQREKGDENLDSVPLSKLYHAFPLLHTSPGKWPPPFFRFQGQFRPLSSFFLVFSFSYIFDSTVASLSSDFSPSIQLESEACRWVGLNDRFALSSHKPKWTGLMWTHLGVGVAHWVGLVGYLRAIWASTSFVTGPLLGPISLCANIAISFLNCVALYRCHPVGPWIPTTRVLNTNNE